MLSYIDMDVANNSHAVPQNIMSVEFKLIGDLSIKQFVFIAVPLVLGFLMYVFHVNNYITIFLTGILLLAAVFIDFVPIDQRPLDIWITNFLIAIKHPTQRVWRKKPQYPSILEIPKQLRPAVVQKKNEDVATFLYQSPIDTSLVSEGTDILDEREKALISNIDRLNSSMGTSTPVSPGIQTPYSQPDLSQQVPSQPSPTAPVGDNSTDDNEKENNGFYYENTPSNTANSSVNQNTQASQVTDERPSYNQYSQTGSQNQPVNSVPYASSNIDTPNIQDNVNTVQTAPSSNSMDNNYSNPLHQAYGDFENTPNNFSGQNVSSNNTSPTVTQTEPNLANQVSGIINNGNINNTSYQSQKDVTEPEDKEEDQIIPPEYRFVDESNTSQNQSSVGTNTIGMDEIMDRLKKLEEENEELRSKLEEKPKEETIEKPIEQTEPQSPNVQAESTPVEAVSENIQQDSQNPTVPSNTAEQKPLSKDDLVKYLPDFVNNPDIISGILLKNESEVIPDAVIIIKDSAQKPVRAIKTNKLGQFFIRTPLQPGDYNLEITYPNLVFNPVYIKLNGEVKEPILIYPDNGQGGL